MKDARMDNVSAVAVALPPGDRNRKGGLGVFGIFTTLFGVVAALLVPLMFFGQAMAVKAGTPSSGGLGPVVLIYGTLAIALVWLGIGSMMARRWARALLLVAAWNWLLVGLVSLAMMVIMLPRMM